MLKVQISRRKALRLLAGGAAFPMVSRMAFGQSYPSRPVRIIVGFPAGGTPDIGTRLIAQWLSDRLGQSFVIENRPGAGTNLAAAEVVRAEPDGYTLLACAFPNAISAAMYGNLKFNFIRDIAPVARINRVPFVMAVNPSFPAQSVREFIAYAKANPGAINMASTGTGNLTHFAGELFKMMAGVDMVHVPYRGEMQAQSDLLAGRAQVMFDPVLSSIGYIKASKLRALAVTTATRLDALPDLPTVGDAVPGYDVVGWGGLGAPRNTPAEIIDKLNRDVNAALADPAIKARFADLGGPVVSGSPADFAKFVADETEKWTKVIKFAGITAG